MGTDKPAPITVALAQLRAEPAKEEEKKADAKEEKKADAKEEKKGDAKEEKKEEKEEEKPDAGPNVAEQKAHDAAALSPPPLKAAYESAILENQSDHENRKWGEIKGAKKEGDAKEEKKADAKEEKKADAKEEKKAEPAKEEKKEAKALVQTLL